MNQHVAHVRDLAPLDLRRGARTLVPQYLRLRTEQPERLIGYIEQLLVPLE